MNFANTVLTSQVAVRELTEASIQEQVVLRKRAEERLEERHEVRSSLERSDELRRRDPRTSSRR